MDWIGRALSASLEGVLDMFAVQLSIRIGLKHQKRVSVYW
jgi:hypothetical protein